MTSQPDKISSIFYSRFERSGSAAREFCRKKSFSRI